MTDGRRKRGDSRGCGPCYDGRPRKIRSLIFGSNLLPVGQVAGIADAGHDVGTRGQLLVDGRRPDGSRLPRHVLHHVVHALLAGYDRRHMRMGRSAAPLAQRVVGQHERRTRSQHGVDQQQRFALQVAARNVFDLHRELPVLGALAVGRDERVLRVVEIIEETLVERQPGTQDGGDDNPVVDLLHDGFAQRRFDRPRRVVQFLREFVGRDFADTLHVAAETHRIGLHLSVANLGDELVEHGVLLAEDMQLHDSLRFGCQ